MSVIVTRSYLIYVHVALHTLGVSHVIAAWCLHELQMDNRQVTENKYTESVDADGNSVSVMGGELTKHSI
jgi:hypothetical protein